MGRGSEKACVNCFVPKLLGCIFSLGEIEIGPFGFGMSGSAVNMSNELPRQILVLRFSVLLKSSCLIMGWAI